MWFCYFISFFLFLTYLLYTTQEHNINKNIIKIVTSIIIQKLNINMNLNNNYHKNHFFIFWINFSYFFYIFTFIKKFKWFIHSNTFIIDIPFRIIKIMNCIFNPFLSSVFKWLLFINYIRDIYQIMEFQYNIYYIYIEFLIL